MPYPGNFCGVALVLAGGLSLLLTSPAQAQQEGVWTQFTKKVGGEYRFGYRDATGRIRLPAKFGMFTNAQEFKHIMAVSEARSLRQYYLLKSGRQVGRDSVYMNDYQADCEQEGFIRFQNPHTKWVGFFDAQGRVVIPAQYNDVTPFYNGLAVALRGARRVCWDGADTVHCEHMGWEGGRQLVINQRNEVVIDSLPADKLENSRLNWYSLQRNAVAVDTATTVTLTAVNGDRYTFTNYDKEFRQWFFGQFVPAVQRGPAAVRPLCYAELATSTQLAFWGWHHTKPEAFVAQHFPVLRAQLAGLRPGAPLLQIGPDDLNLLTFTGAQFAGFLTDCGAHFAEKYPVFSVILSVLVAGSPSELDHQCHYSFIRTAQGYRLYQASF